MMRGFLFIMMMIIIVQWINDKKVCMLNTDAEVTTYSDSQHIYASNQGGFAELSHASIK